MSVASYHYCIWLADATIIYLFVLFNHQSLDVSRLNGTGTFIWQTVLQETIWPGVINSIHLSSLHANTFEETENLVRTFVQSLVDEGWITLASEEKKEHVLSTDD